MLRTSKRRSKEDVMPDQEMLLVASKAKAALKAYEVNVSGDALESLNMVVYWYLDQAAKRAKANGRKTVRGHDFMSM
jgi:histone H3/H4